MERSSFVATPRRPPGTASERKVVNAAISSSRLQSATAIYGLLCLAFVLLASIPLTRGLIVWDSRPASAGLELILTQLLFILFLLGYIASWPSKLVAGMVFVLWYALVWWSDAFSTRYGAGGGMGPDLGLPVFIFGIIFVVFGVQKERLWLEGREVGPRKCPGK